MHRHAERLEIARGVTIGADRRQHAQRTEVRDHRRPAVAQKRRHDARERHHAKDAGRHDQHRHDQKQRERGAEEETVVVSREPCDAEAAPGEERVQHGNQKHACSAELLADRRENQIGVAGRQIARVAQTEPGAKRSAGRQSPDRVRHLIAARNGVVPWRLPHAHALRERLRDMQAIADIEAEYQEREAGDRHPDPPARDGIGREKDAAEKQRRTQILLNVEEDERETDTGEDRHHVLGARQVDPSRPARPAEHRAADFPEQFPPARKEPARNSASSRRIASIGCTGPRLTFAPLVPGPDQRGSTAPTATAQR